MRIGIVGCGMGLGRALVSMLASSALIACAVTPEAEVVPQIQVVEKKVPVRQACIEAKDLPPRPKYLWGVGNPPEDAKAKAGILLVDYENAKAYGTALEALTVGCVETTPNKP
ncbi:MULTISPECIES: hypothetical protein [Pseudomonas]|uniref:Lipoprotein n=1 Tax=Pseudomonas lutea TaxID=243924 RepID=A0A9X8QLS9_9PSED|nr:MULTISPECIES: hypothetical protein [Pseudomonas]SER37995.1 hypothetical protein SAMN05216409_118120 [Pseudomonas lutea]